MKTRIFNKLTEVEVEKSFKFKDSDNIFRYFDEYRSLGIILNDSFEDNTWILHNEIIKIKVNFNINMDLINEDILIETKIALKLYCLILLTKTVILSVYESIKTIISFLKETNFANVDNLKTYLANFIKNKKYRDKAMTLAGFNEFYILNSSDLYKKNFVDFYQSFNIDPKDRGKRDLPTIDSIFKLQNLIEEIDCYPIDEQKKFFLILLWWKITTIIPLRVTEFTLIPYECLINRNGRTYLKIFRSRLKGQNRRVPRHKVSLDYKPYELPVDQEIIRLIEKYNDIVREEYLEIGIKSEKRRFLLSRRLHYNNIVCGLDKKEYDESRIDVNILSNLLNKFYREIIKEKYKFSIIKKNSKISIADDEIEEISLMDTRHIAFINLILNDVDPIMIKEIAGHKRVDSSFHYFDRIGTYLESRTYNLLQKNKFNKHMNKNVKRRVDPRLKNKDLFLEDKIISREVKDGRCFAGENVFEKCVKVNGECYLCEFFDAKNTCSKEITNRLERNNKEIKEILIRTIELIKMYKERTDYLSRYSTNIQKINSLAMENNVLIKKIDNITE
ncbi:hypothetical protein ACV3P1_01675 [Clostridium perfringens]|nr:hypothetical protein [Clostridium perfringens]